MMIFLVSRHSEAWHSRAIGAKAQSFVAYFYKKFNSYSYSARPKMATKLRYKLDASQLSIDPCGYSVGLLSLSAKNRCN
jgi:hypothetical protein